MDKVTFFELEISRPGLFRAGTSATGTLPAGPYELRDLLEKARITDERVIYSIEILDSKLDYLPQFISSSTNLYELNHLAKRLASLSQWELDCFEGMVMMDAIQTEYAPITVERLINMTHSMSDCQVVYEAHDDRTLGKFYADNDFVPKLEGVPDEVYSCLDFEKIGKEMREGEGGVFTSHGYVLQNGEIAKTYQSGDAALPEKPDYTILLSIGKGYYHDPEYDNDLTVQLKLPADDAAVAQAVEAIGAASLREGVFRVEDCIVPRLSELIADELNVCDGDITVVDALAEQLQKLDREGRLPVYKAMLEAGPKDLARDHYGYHVAVIDLRNPTRSDGNNMLHLVNTYMDQYLADENNLVSKAKAEKYAKIISKTIINASGENYGQNQFFYDAAEGLLSSVILLIAEYLPPTEVDGKKVDCRHIISVFKLVQDLLAPSKVKGKSQFQLLMDKLPSDHKARWFAGAALNSAEQAMASVLSTVLSRLNSFLDSEMEQILCFETAIDAEKFCKEKSALFIVLPEEDLTKYFMVSLMIQQLYREILAVADENGGKLKNRVMFYCDELGTLPAIESLELIFSASRSRRLSMVPIIQSFGQLVKNYGKEGSEIIVDNCRATRS